MADVHLPDHVLYNILACLPAKPLFRFRRVSKHWNCLIKDPYLMKLRSRHGTILLKSSKSLLAIYDVHVDKFKVNSGRFGRVISIVGAFNGIVILFLEKDIDQQLILYNPFTRVSKMLPNPPSGYCKSLMVYTFGFAYGATMDDLKIVRLNLGMDSYYRSLVDCDVFSFKNTSWEKVKHYNNTDIKFFDGDVGKFLNGFLYWIGYSVLRKVVVIAALNVTDMVFSEINTPVLSTEYFPLGIIDGCLCKIDKSGDDMGINVWVMKEQGVESSWSVLSSIWLEGCDPVCILDSGRILIEDYFSNQHIIYYTSNGTFKNLDFTENLHDGIDILKEDGTNYVESLVSPSDLFHKNKSEGETRPSDLCLI